MMRPAEIALVNEFREKMGTRVRVLENDLHVAQTDRDAHAALAEKLRDALKSARIILAEVNYGAALAADPILSLTPTDAPREHDLRVAEAAYIEGYDCGRNYRDHTPERAANAWANSATFRRLEGTK